MRTPSALWLAHRIAGPFGLFFDLFLLKMLGMMLESGDCSLKLPEKDIRLSGVDPLRFQLGCACSLSLQEELRPAEPVRGYGQFTFTHEP
jgi:hypothetical protein